MDDQRQDDQEESTYSGSVPIRDVAPKTYRKQWTIGRCGERRSRISVLMARLDDDDDDDDNLLFYLLNQNCHLFYLQRKFKFRVECHLTVVFLSFEKSGRQFLQNFNWRE